MTPAPERVPDGGESPGNPGVNGAGRRPPAIMSVDVEDWFHVENLRGAIARESWDERERRVVANTHRIIAILADAGVRGTFFCLGWVAEREPDLIRGIAEAGHEVASHGYDHRLVYEQPIADFRDDVVRAKSLLEDITGEAVLGYRAPSFSITEESLRVLRETGHRYDSSWFPTGGHDRYGRVDLMPRDGSPSGTNTVTVVPAVLPLGRHEPPSRAGARARADTRADTAPFFELPITTRVVAGKALPWGGGGWFRLFPGGLFRRGFAAAVEAAGGGMFYLHPWEVDPDQPRVTGIKRGYAFRHYVNLGKTADRLAKLCRVVPFERADRVLGLR